MVDSPRSSCTSTIQNQAPHRSASCLSTYSPPPEEERNQNLCRKTLICIVPFLFLDIFHISSDETKNHRTFQAGGKMVGRRGQRGKGSIKDLRLYVMQHKGTSLSNRIYSDTGTIPYPDAPNPNVSGQTTSLAPPSTCPKK